MRMTTGCDADVADENRFEGNFVAVHRSVERHPSLQHKGGHLICYLF